MDTGKINMGLSKWKFTFSQIIGLMTVCSLLACESVVDLGIEGKTQVPDELKEFLRFDL